MSRSSRSGSRSRRRQKSKRRGGAGVVLYILEAIVAMAAMAGIIAFLLWHNSFKKINMADYVELSVKGYDHYGTADVIINGEMAYSQFWSTVTATADRTENLSNGDVVNISFTYDEDAAKACKLRVNGADSEAPIEGLPESVIVDNDFLFSGLEITTESLSPKASVKMENTSEDPFLSQVNYYFEDEGRFYANGESCRIHAEIPEELLESHEYVLAGPADELVYEYQVETADTYVMDADLIRGEALSTLEQYATGKIYAADANEYGLRIFQQEAHIQPVFKGHKTTFTWDSPYVISAYFHSATPAGLQAVDAHANDVQIIYGVTIRQADGKSCLTEVVVQFTNIVEHADHTLNLDPETGRIVSATYKDKNIKKLVSVDSNEEYDTVKLTE